MALKTRSAKPKVVATQLNQENSQAKSKTGQRNADAMTLTSFNTAVQISESGINSNPPPSGTPPSLALQSFNFPMYPGSHPLLAQQPQQPITSEPEKKIRIPSSSVKEMKCQNSSSDRFFFVFSIQSDTGRNRQNEKKRHRFKKFYLFNISIQILQILIDLNEIYRLP